MEILRENRRAFLIISGVITLMALFFIRIHNEKIFSISDGDDEAFFAYARSLVIDHDWNFSNEPTGTFKNHPKLAANYPIGPGTSWIPFLSFGHLVASVIKVDPPELLLKGIGVTDFLAAGVGSGTLAVCGLFCLFLLLRNYFSFSSSILSVLLIPLAGPLPHYIFRRPLMSHPFEFFILSLSFLLVSRLSVKTKLSSWIFAGLAVGGIFLARWNDAIFTVALGLFAVSKIVEKDKKINDWEWRNLLIFFAVVGLTSGMQLANWKYQLGTWYPGLEMYGSTSFPKGNFLIRWNPWTLWRLRDILIGRDWGILLMTPILSVVILAGLVLSWRRLPRPLLLTLLIPSLANIFIIANFTGHGAEYAHRYLTPMWIIFTVFHAVILESLISRKIRRNIFIGLSSASLIFSLLLLIQFKTNDSTLTLSMIPAKNLIGSDWANFEYTENATRNIKRMVTEPKYGASLFSPSPIGYFLYRAVKATGHLPASIAAPFEDYLQRHLANINDVPLGRLAFFWLLYVGGATALFLKLNPNSKLQE